MLDDPKHAELAARTLRISVDAWTRVLAACSSDGPLADRLAAFARAFGAARPLPDGSPLPCIACGGDCVPFVNAEPGLVYGRCVQCGHGSLFRGASGARPDYYVRKDEGRSGYDAYESERAYREEKGRRLVDRLLREHAAAKTLLEVGSGFGFTRAAACERGLTTYGVDVSPEAAEGARRLYGFDTFTGTLADASPPPCDLVLYQFVLEHIADVVAELRAAARALAPNGLACFVVPSMEATEIEVFGGAYRSFRSDHVHLFTARSLRWLLGAAGLEPVSIASTCNLHLLSPVLSPAELQQLYESGAGPDLIVLARGRRPS